MEFQQERPGGCPVPTSRREQGRLVGLVAEGAVGARRGREEKDGEEHRRRREHVRVLDCMVALCERARSSSLLLGVELSWKF